VGVVREVPDDRIGDAVQNARQHHAPTDENWTQPKAKREDVIGLSICLYEQMAGERPNSPCPYLTGRRRIWPAADRCRCRFRCGLTSGACHEKIGEPRPASPVAALRTVFSGEIITGSAVKTAAPQRFPALEASQGATCSYL
jgi:hypothetical protein